MTTKPINDTPTPTQRFIWWLAGADIPLLEECRSEWHKFTAIGCSVLVVVLLSVVAGTFFFTESFQAPLALAIPGGLFWGFIVLTIDRTLLTHFHKGKGIIGVVLRLLFALTVALAIDHPLLLKSFEGEIEARLRDSKEAKLRSTRSNSDKQGATSLVEKRISQLEDRLTKLQNLRDDAKVDMENERGGNKTDRTSGRIGEGREFEIKRRTFESAERDLEVARPSIEAELQEKRDELKTLSDALGAEVNAVDQVESNAAGVLNRNKALLAMLTEEPGSAFIAVVLFLIFLGIDTLPLTQKLMSGKTKYDFMQDEYLRFVQEEAAQSFEQKRATMRGAADAENEVMARILRAVGSAEWNLENSAERDLSRMIHMNVLRSHGSRFGGKPGADTSVSDGLPVNFEVIEYPQLTAQVVIPSSREASITLDQLQKQVDTFVTEVSKDYGKPMTLKEVTNSDGDYIDQVFLPLVQQLKPDRRVLMRFEPSEARTDTGV